MQQTWLSLIPFLVACAAAGASGAAFRPGDWYRRLDKPSWTPPDWVFPVAWTALYLLIAWAGWRVGLRAGTGEAAMALGLWACQIALNTLWPPLFFGLHRPERGLVVIVLLWLTVATMLGTFFSIDGLAGLAVVPYLLWVSYAAVLNIAIWQRNPHAHLIGAERPPSGEPPPAA